MTHSKVLKSSLQSAGLRAAPIVVQTHQQHMAGSAHPHVCLMLLCSCAWSVLLSLCCATGIPVNSKNRKGMNPLMMAAAGGHTGMWYWVLPRVYLAECYVGLIGLGFRLEGHDTPP
jgi:hypothetical protein